MSGDRYGDYELVVGLEVHCQLDTKRKLFCDAPSRFGQAPNTCADPYSWGLPGVLPVPNRKAIELGVRLALALECELASVSSWARKHYFYPCLLYTSPSPRDATLSRMPSSA